MSDCTRREELTAAIRSGHWPAGCTADLQQHVASCSLCTAEARMLSAFAAARAGTMQTLPAQSADLLWWKAQLRRRHDAMEQLQRPAIAISAATLTASILILLSAAAIAWRHNDWKVLQRPFASDEWNAWVVLSLAVVLCSFVVVAVVVASEPLRERG